MSDGRLLRLGYHVVDSSFNQVIRQIGASALGGHYACFTRVALDRVFVERVFALRDTRRPSRFIVGARRSADAVEMTRAAHLLVNADSVGRNSELRHDGPRSRNDRESGVVLASDGDSPRREIFFDVSDVLGVEQKMGALGLAAHRSRQREQQDRDDDEDAEHDAEDIEELGVLFTHDDIQKALGKVGPEYSCYRGAGASAGVDSIRNETPTKFAPRALILPKRIRPSSGRLRSNLPGKMSGASGS